MERLKLAVLISGRGSNLQALIEACARPDYPAEIVLVLANVAGAQGLARAERAGIATAVVSHTDYPDRRSFDSEMTAAIERSGADLVCLAGFLRILSAEFIDYWRDRLINIHPSLLPAFKGLDTHRRALEAGVRIAGCTVHYVRFEMDTGPVVVQAAVPVLPGDSPETLAERVLEREHQIYPLAVKLIAEGRVTIAGEVAEIRDPAAPGDALINPGLES